MFGFLMQCWCSYSYRNDRYVFRQGDMTCLRSSKIPLIPSKTKYPPGKHPNNLMPKKTSLGMGSEPTSASCVVRKTRSLGALACAMFHDMLCNMVFVNCIYNMVVDTQFHKFHGRPFARVIRAKRVSNCYIPNSKFVCSTNLGFSGGSNRYICLLYTSPSPRDKRQSRMPSSA